MGFENYQPSGNEGLYKTKDGQFRVFADPDINATNILGGGLEFVRGKDISPEVRARVNGGIQLPNKPSLPNLGGSASDITSQLTASLPSVNAEDLKKRTQEEFAGTRATLQKSFDQRIAEATGLGEQEKRALGGELGTGRRFSSSAQAFIKYVDEENKKKVATLEMQRDEALANMDFKLAELVDKRIANERTIQQQDFENMFKIIDFADKKQKADDEKAKAGIQSTRDAAIAGLMSQGITDPIKILDFLNFNEDGEQVGDFSAEEINKTLKNLTIEKKDAKNLPDDIEKFEYLRNSALLPPGILDLPEDQQYFAFLNMMKLAESGKLTKAAQLYGGDGGMGGRLHVGVGASTEVEEQIVRTRLFAKLSTILNKGTLSDADREIIDSRISEFREAGLSEQEIMSRLAGFPSDVNTAYNVPFIELATISTKTNEEQQQLMGKLGILLENGNFQGAMELLESKAFSRLTDEKLVDSGSLVSEADVTFVKNKADEITELLGEGWANEVGAFTGTFQSWLSKKFGIGQSAKIRAKIGSLTADLVNKRAGSALTDSEWERLVQPNVPQMNDSAKTFKTKLDELVDNPLSRLNSERSLVSLPQLGIDEVMNKELRLRLYERPDNMRVKDSAAKQKIIDLGQDNPEIQEKFEMFMSENPNADYSDFLEIIGVPLSISEADRVSSVKIPEASRLAYVNNNPGNLKFANQSGATPGENGFAKFPSPGAGFKALLNQIKIDMGRNLTLEEFITKYAPPTENETNTYIKQIASATSTKPTTRLTQIPLLTLAKAIARKESSSLVI